MSELWAKYKKRIIAVISAAILALVAIFNEALTDLLSGNTTEEPVVEAPVDEVAAEPAVVIE